jgi:glycolate oxidase iron-sulfur subunit
MQHNLPLDQLGPLGHEMAQAVEKCVHCGFCLPACPTYAALGEEMDSPRGRIVLMKLALERELDLEEALPYIDRCLGCLGCASVCPSGVAYGELLTPFRAYAETRRRRPPAEALARRLALETIPYPARFRLAAAAGRAAKPARALLPAPLRAMLDLLPERMPSSARLPNFVSAVGVRRARVAFLAGCVQQAMDPAINAATLRVLARNGVEVILPDGQGCCGALAIHLGRLDEARRMAEHNLRLFPRDVDAVLTNAAGCGSGMKEYPLLFKGTAGEDMAARAAEFAAQAQDVSVFLDALGLLPPPPLPQRLRLAYHDACHLAHAQRVTEEPRCLLRAIPGVELLPLAEGDLCCGSAGVYNLEQPETARLLGRRKARHIQASGAQAVAAGNIGCLVQLRAALLAAGAPLPVWHTMQVLDQAYMSPPAPADPEGLLRSARDAQEVHEMILFLGRRITRDDVLRAMREYDGSVSLPAVYDNWLAKDNFKYALIYDHKLYPPKYILSLASGFSTQKYNGGEQTNSAFRALGFEIIDKPRR